MGREAVHGWRLGGGEGAVEPVSTSPRPPPRAGPTREVHGAKGPATNPVTARLARRTDDTETRVSVQNREIRIGIELFDPLK